MIVTAQRVYSGIPVPPARGCSSPYVAARGDGAGSSSANPQSRHAGRQSRSCRTGFIVAVGDGRAGGADANPVGRWRALNRGVGFLHRRAFDGAARKRALDRGCCAEAVAADGYLLSRDGSEGRRFRPYARCIAARLLYCNADDRPFDATDAAAALIGKRLTPPTIAATAEGAAPAVGRTAAFMPARRSSVSLAETFTRRAVLQANDRAMK
jgi:hypothetical protein